MPLLKAQNDWRISCVGLSILYALNALLNIHQEVSNFIIVILHFIILDFSRWSLVTACQVLMVLL